VISFILLAFIFPYLFLIIRQNQFLGNVKFNELNHKLKPLNKFSIIIPTTNEIFELELLIESLENQFYPKEFFEILIFVDGNSKLKETFDKKFKEHEVLKILGSDSQLGKKKALSILIEASKFNNIIQLDADATIGGEFILGYDQIFRQNLPDCIVGPVKPIIEEIDNFSSKFFALDFMSLQSIQVANCLKNKANLANGTNLFFTKIAYNEVKKNLDAFDSPSGDDTFLVQLLKKNNKKIVWGDLKEILVMTPLPQSWQSFIEQRIRWGSKTKLYVDNSLKTLAIATILASLALIASLVLTVFGKILLVQLAFLFFVKGIIDFIYIKKLLNLYQLNFLQSHFVASTLIYPFYLVFAAYKANFGSYQWKNITYAPNKKS